MKKILVTFFMLLVVGGGGYAVYTYTNSSSNFDKDIQVAPEQSKSEKNADVTTEQMNDDSQGGNIEQANQENDSYDKGYAAGVEIGKEDNRVGYIGQATPGATTDSEFVRGWTDGRKATNRPGLTDKSNDAEMQDGDPDTNGLPATHTYHITDKNGDDVYCSYDSSKKQFIENVRNDVQPRIFSKDGQQIQ